ncbi:MarR family winged helix-turn-helix transcriptional regulator [Haloimpatiens sp. FM7315]|uniref:MarR family winged helix-turn-helix transcriptional regulator n=1 Tax=Haloimpatiens sp. FM7315 TaxID=3298609 RepID=UPI0035A3C29A
MKDNTSSIMATDLCNLLLTLHRKIFNPIEIRKTFTLPPSNVMVIFYLNHKDSTSISEIAKELIISKPNMTPIIDNLISEGLVIRYEDTKDRRIIRVKLTDKAHNFIKKQEEIMKISLSEKLSNLNPEEITSLKEHIYAISSIVSKI